MNPLAKKSLAFLLVLIMLAILYYGSYLPWKKSRLYITALQGLQSASSIEEFKEKLAVPLAIPSPIGQEELVRSTASSLLGVLQSPGRDPATIRAIMDTLNSYYTPILEKGEGMSFNQNLYILGLLNEIAFIQTREEVYLRDSLAYFTESLKRGEKRPQPLLGLFDVYRLMGDRENTQKIGGKILEQWPTDAQTKQVLEELSLAGS